MMDFPARLEEQVDDRNYWFRIERDRISRRRMLTAMGVGASGLALAAACGGGSSDSSTGKTPAASATQATVAAGPPKRGGVWKASNQGAWGTIDPMVSVGNATGILPKLYNVLISRSNADPTFIFYDLAQSFEQVDEQTYLFKIRPGVKIAPNSLGIPERDMDALDAQRSIERAHAENDVISRVFTEPWVDVAQANGDTFTFKTKGAYSYFLSEIGRALGGTIPPREAFEQKISLRDQAAGAGSFMIKPGSYEETGSVVLQRNPNYYRTDEKSGLKLPFIDSIESSLITDRQARRTAFLGKQIYSYGAADATEAKELVSQNKSLYISRSPAFTFISFTMNPTRDPWKDDRIRKAALHALDRKQFIDLIVGEGEGKPDGLVHWPTGPYAFNETELDEFQKYDPKQSRDLIKAATGNDTIKVKITYPVSDIEFHDKHLPIFLKQMKEAGFDVQEDPKDFSAWLGDYTDVKYDASLSLNQIYETPRIALDWQSAKGPAGDGHFAIGIGSIYPEVEKAIMDSKQAKDQQDHFAKVRAAQKVVYDKGPAFLPIFSWYAYTLYWDFVKNVHELGDTGTFLSDTWLDL
jgi:ABC-type transport system substrate-binding protein